MDFHIKCPKLFVLGIVFILLSGAAPLLWAQTVVTVNPGVQHQTTEGWGTSLCWFGNVTGRWSDANRNAIADLLFDAAKGLGINLIRYNIGGGDNPGHNHMGYGREMEGFKTSESGAYDWNADPGQRWMLQAAKSRIAADEFFAEAFSNSPPYWMTNSGCASGGDGNNLKSGYYDDFADYLTEVARHFRDSWSINFRTLEPMNEPNLGWGANGGQEGCHFDRSLQDDMIRELKAKLDSKGLNIQIAAPDETNIDDTITSYNSYDSTTRSYISQINTHVYSGSNRLGLKDLAVREGKRLWQSECDGSGAPAPFDDFTHNHNDIAPGLDLAMRINRDQRDMKPDGWIFWQAVESEQVQVNLNKNWGLIHADFENGTESYTLTKKYYTMAQYTKFIRPGYTMIDINNTDAVAFAGRQQGRLVIVQRNATGSDVSYTYNLSGFIATGTSAAVYRTSASENFQSLSAINISNKQFTAVARANSITTYVISNIQIGTPAPTPTPQPTPAGTNLSLNKSVAASSAESSNPASNGNDGSVSTRWCADSGTTPQWWRVDLGGNYNLNGTVITWEFTGAYGYRIEVSANDSNWTTVAEKTSSTQVQVDYFTANPVRYVRITVTSLASGNWASFFECAVYGTPAGQPTPTAVIRRGDVNNDGTVTIVDALMTAQYYVGLTPAEFNTAAADVNCDGGITIVDALMIAQYYVGLLTQFC